MLQGTFDRCRLVVVRLGAIDLSRVVALCSAP